MRRLPSTIAMMMLCALGIAGVPVVAGAAESDSAKSGPYVQGRGFRLIDDEFGQVNFKLLTYFRYLNQNGLDETYVDAFGQPRAVDRRLDFQMTKMNLTFYGWFMDPRFRFVGYVWTSNASQGQLAQVVVAGSLNYTFNSMLTLGGGIAALPTTRSTEGNWPHWLPVDNRLIADDYFRGSFTSGIWANGALTSRLAYRIMLGNNLSQLGIDATQLDNTLNTWSGMVAWMPTTGEFGTADGFGDYDRHETVATRVGVHASYSGESSQSQPSTEAIENSQIRISDGNIVFTPFLFGPGIAITDVVYKMFSVDAGAKYRGLSLETEFYWRVVDDLRGLNVDQLTFDKFSDRGFDVLASAMLRPSTAQIYAGTSKIFGEYGDPWEVRGGLNVFPWKNKAIRWNSELIHLEHSPVGNSGYPYPVGANGLAFSSTLEVNF